MAAIAFALLGAGINNAAALVAMVVAYAVMGRLGEPLTVGWKRGVPLLLSGAASAVGTAGFILALQYGGTVAVGTALKNTAPLFTFVLAIWLLHGHERLNVRVLFWLASWWWAACWRLWGGAGDRVELARPSTATQS